MRLTSDGDCMWSQTTNIADRSARLGWPVVKQANGACKNTPGFLVELNSGITGDW